MSRNKLPENLVQHLFAQEGEAMFTMAFAKPWAPPSAGATTLIKAPSLETLTHLEITDTPSLRVTRITKNAEHVAEVNIQPLLEVERWVVHMCWSPEGIVVQVGDDNTSDILFSSRG